ncbi:YcgL domain-containing protein [Hahella sp. NBU794]|uniref:YcgL domain-containing protein n=1 Tax=Hahella sp. NBU794 TaxID=3422590 RepID=UPI003D6EF687
MTPDRRLISIFRSSKKEEMYVYVDKKQGVGALPEALLQLFGKPQHVFDLLLTKDKPLARADAAEVMSAIDEKGFYLQMPSIQDDYMMDVVRAREQRPAVGRKDQDD